MNMLKRLLPAALLLLAACSDPSSNQESATAQESAAAAASAAAQVVEEAVLDTEAVELAQQLLLIDTHIDVPYRLHNGWVDVSQATEDGDFDFPRAKAGGLDAMFMSIYIPADVDTRGEAGEFADALIDLVETIAESAPDQFAIATCAADVDAIKANGMIAMPMGMENGGPIAGDFARLQHFRDRGIRYVTLTHSKSNHISDSSYDLNEQWQGLSEFGKSLIPEMNRQGIMVDVSHISDKAFWQVLELSQTPVIASHSSMRHFTPGFQRNMTDEMVAALKDNGGVIQINFGSGFLTAEARNYANASQQAFLRFRAEEQLEAGDPRLAEFGANYRLENPYPYATVDDVLDHIDRAVEFAGIDHVGIGSDYDGVGDTLPIGLKDVSQYPNLVAGLLERGYSEEDIAKILGGNLMRVWREVEAFAAAAGTPVSCLTTTG
jgi:membrane dipeptidase